MYNIRELIKRLEELPEHMKDTHYIKDVYIQDLKPGNEGRDGKVVYEPKVIGFECKVINGWSNLTVDERNEERASGGWLETVVTQYHTGIIHLGKKAPEIKENYPEWL